MTEFKVKENDIPTMLESLEELFHEIGDEVTPTKLAERMSSKLGREVRYYYASFLFNQLGFVTRSASEGCSTRALKYIIRDYELLEKVKRW